MHSDTTSEFERIEDWSREGRLGFFRNHETAIRLALDLAFTDLMDSAAVSLVRFGFRGDDPVAEAVEWSIERFVGGELDSSKVKPEHRSMQLFTVPHFWLSQKVGRAAYDIIWRQVVAFTNGTAASGDAVLAPDRGSHLRVDELNATKRQLASTLARLRACTCPPVVKLWLRGSAKFREEWFGWQIAASNEPDQLPGKKRSLLMADALFRYFVLFLGWDQERDEACQVVRRSLLDGCEDEPPYRALRSGRRDAHSRPAPSSRALSTSVETLVVWACDLAEAVTDRERATFASLLATKSIKASLLHHFRIEAAEVRIRVKGLKGLLR